MWQAAGWLGMTVEELQENYITRISRARPRRRSGDGAPGSGRFLLVP
jgi:hypothetical protein